MRIKKWISGILAAVLALSMLVMAGCNQEEGSSVQIPKVDYTKVTLSCLGDSITDERQAEKYPTMIGRTMNLMQVNNYGSSGATLSAGHKSNPDNTLLNQLDKVAMDSDIITVMAGVNDYKYHHVTLGQKGDTDTMTFYGGLKALIEGLKERCPDAWLVFITPYKCLNYQQANNVGNKLEDYVNAIIDMCNEYDVEYINFFETGGFDYTNPEYTMDKLHPLSYFYEAVATPKLVDYIKKNYPKYYRNLMISKDQQS